MPELRIVASGDLLEGTLVSEMCFLEVVHHHVGLAERAPRIRIRSVDLKRFLEHLRGLHIAPIRKALSFMK